jgi:hypothetical protein
MGASSDPTTVRIVIVDDIFGRLSVDRGAGGKGLDGKPGTKGANGGQGEHTPHKVL